MRRTQAAKLLRIYMSESDRYGGKSPHARPAVADLADGLLVLSDVEYIRFLRAGEEGGSASATDTGG